MRNIRKAMVILLTLVMILGMSAVVFAEATPKTTMLFVKTQELGAHTVEDYKMDVATVTNVTKTESVERGFYGIFNHTLKMEVLGSTTITSTMDEVTLYVVQINQKGDTYYTIEEYYQDEEHYVIEDSGYEYYKKGSYIKLNKPGKYNVYAVVSGNDFGIIGEITITPDKTQKLTVNPTASKVYGM